MTSQFSFSMEEIASPSLVLSGAVCPSLDLAPLKNTQPTNPLFGSPTTFFTNSSTWWGNRLTRTPRCHTLYLFADQSARVTLPSNDSCQCYLTSEVLMGIDLANWSSTGKIFYGNGRLTILSWKSFISAQK